MISRWPVLLAAGICAATMPLAIHGHAQQYSLQGPIHLVEEHNATLIDLQTPRDFRGTETLVADFMGRAPAQVVARFVPKGCPFGNPCEILGADARECEKFDVAQGRVSIPVTRAYSNIIQISFHSGKSGNAWHCIVNGGPMSKLSAIRVR
jgi:hypothetical protein